MDKTVLVHKKDAEGGLIIDSLTGAISQPLDERPDWSEGLVRALVGERHHYYTTRLGPNGYTDDIKNPQAIYFEDLGWLAVDAEGDLMELEADAEHRMATIAGHIGVSRPDNLTQPETHTKGTVVATVDVEPEYSGEEATALEHATKTGFGSTVGSGTNG